MTERNEFPFIYLYHGKPMDIYSFQGEKYLIFCFRESISQQISDEIDKAAPKIITGSTLWTGNLYMNYSVSDEDEITGYYLKKRRSGYDSDFNDELFKELYTEFADDIEKWVMKVHTIAPIDFFIGHNRIAGSKWDKFSESKLPEVINRLSTLTNNANERAKRIIYEAAMLLKNGKSKKLPPALKHLLEELTGSD